MNKRLISISAVVACRNEARYLRGFLESLLQQDTNGMQFEAILADGLSDDESRKVIEGYSTRDPRIRAITNPGRVASTGLNLAIREARGEIILRMDCHTRYAPDYCRRCVELLLATGAENVGGPARTHAQGWVHRAIAAAYHSPFSTGGAKFHNQNYEGWVDTVTYGCWRKETLERIGLFDETLVRNQDDELNLRLIRRGGKIWQDPKIKSWYSPRANLADLFRQYFQYGYWKVAVIRKHRLPGSWRHLIPVAFVAGNAVLLLAAMIAGAGGQRALAVSLAELWVLELSIYGCVALAASIHAARKSGWATLPYLPAVFLTYHASYGIGFMAGMFRFLSSPAETAPQCETIFTQITR
jgi:succinoglycan biosynthesis protein ExoA